MGTRTQARMPSREGAMTRWQNGQVPGVQFTWEWQATPSVIVNTAAMSTIGTTTRQIVFWSGIFGSPR